MVESGVSQDGQVEQLAVERSDYDSDEGDDEKRVSVMTDTFGPSGHNPECKTGRCSLTSVSLGSDDEDDHEDECHDYVSAIPILILPRDGSGYDESEEADTISDSVFLTEYRRLPKHFIDHKEGRKQTSQSFSTEITEKYPRSRSPTYENDAKSFVTA